MERHEIDLSATRLGVDVLLEIKEILDIVCNELSFGAIVYGNGEKLLCVDGDILPELQKRARAASVKLVSYLSNTGNLNAS